MRMFFDYYWLIPLGRTVFSRGLVKVLMSSPIDWTIGRRRIEEGVLATVIECSTGNLKGRMLELSKEEGELLKICASPSASLPIYVFRQERSGNLYEIKLVEYSDVK